MPPPDISPDDRPGPLRVKRILFLFFDGVGLGQRDGDNPFAQSVLPAFDHLGGGRPWLQETHAVREPARVFIPLDATLGVEGLPQSGTGQASLFTGMNCARIAGRHFGPFPHSSSRSVIAGHNIFRRLIDRCGIEPADLAFANAYPDRFFSYVRQTDRWTVTTLCCLEAHVALHGEADLLAGLAIPANLTGEGWPGRTIPTLTEEEAANRLLRIASSRRLTLFEYFQTDKAGHGRPGPTPVQVLASLDRFLGSLLEGLDDETLLIVTSDHGNMENLSTRGHTRNPVPLVAYGPGAGIFAEARSITDVTPRVVDSLCRGAGSSVQGEAASTSTSSSRPVRIS